MSDKIRAQEIYDQAKQNLVGQEGKIIAIELESGDYFLGENSLTALQEAKKSHPHKKFYILRVGCRAAYFIGNAAQ